MTVEQAVTKATYIARSINVDERYPLSFAHAVETIAEALLEASNNSKGE